MKNKFDNQKEGKVEVAKTVVDDQAAKNEVFSTDEKLKTQKQLEPLLKGFKKHRYPIF